MKIPAKGQRPAEVLGALDEYRKSDVDWKEGKVFGFVFHANEEATELVEEAFVKYMWENALDPTLFRSILRMETEIVAMCAAHLGGDENVVGNFTSGGTESVLLAVKTARDWARDKKPQIKKPQMIVPITAHAAFHKAAHYFDIEAVVVPVDPKTFKADLNAVRAAVNENTILIVGSAVSFSHGVVDPIREMAAIAQERGILMHVDGCIGGFLLPLFRRLGAKVTDFDFSVPGVTSMSMDLHKYAFAAKGASVVLYKNKDLRQYQIFTCSKWTGYTMINPTIQSTKSGGPVAGAWAVLHHMGYDGYLKVAQQLKDATDKFVAAIRASKDFEILGDPEISLVAVGSKTLNIYEVVDEMTLRGYHLGPQPGLDGMAANFHMTIMPQTTPNIDDLLKNLFEVAEIVRQKPRSEMMAQIKDFAKTLDAKTLDADAMQNLLSMAGMNGVGIPERMAEINELLESLPRDVADKLLAGFYNELAQYRKA